MTKIVDNLNSVTELDDSLKVITCFTREDYNDLCCNAQEDEECDCEFCSRSIFILD